MKSQNYNTNLLIDSNIPDWHFPMLNDELRNIKYFEAIKKSAKDKVVLDLGSGSGILSMMALEAGAKKVFAVEQDQALINISKQIFKDNNMLSDKLVIINSAASKLKLGINIDSPIDLVVTEVFDCGLIGEGCLESISHIKSFLSSEGLILPKKADIYGCLVNSDKLREKYHLDGKIMGFDLTAFSELRQVGAMDNAKYYQDLKIVSDIRIIKSLNFNRNFSNIIEEKISFDIKESCFVDAMILWFNLHLSDGIHFSSFLSAETHWDQWFLFPRYPIRTSSEKTLSVKLNNTTTGKIFPIQWKTNEAVENAF